MCVNFNDCYIFVLVLNVIIKPDGFPDSQLLKKEENNQNINAFKFDWVPPNIHQDLASEYMQLLPSDKLPISGSEGALYRRQQLEKQVPLHDFNANVCHNLTTEETNAMSSYLENLKENAVGQGLVKKLSDNVNPVPSFKNMNLTPKPFKKLYNQDVGNDEEFPPPPPELLYPSMTELKTPSSFIGNKNYLIGDTISEINTLDNVNNNPAVSGHQVVSQQPISTLAKVESLPQLQTNFSSNIKNDNYKPTLHDQNVGKPLKNLLQKNAKVLKPSANNADTFVLSDDKVLLCKQCKKNVVPGQVAVMAERAGKEVLWHPPCFVCSTCEVLFKYKLCDTCRC